MKRKVHLHDADPWQTRLGRTVMPAVWLAEYVALVGFQAGMSLLPRRWRLRLGRAVGRLAYRVLGSQRRAALDNLRQSFPDAGEAWCAAVARGSFAHLGRLLVEVLGMGRESHHLAERLRIEGREHLEAVAAAGTGYILLSGHFGNWEWVALHQGALGHRLGMVIRPLDNPFLERWLARNRTATGNRLIAKRNALREVVRGLRDGVGVALVIDQNFHDIDPHFVPFFGRLAATTPTLGNLAARMRVPVLPVFATPQEDGTYRVVYQAPIVAPSTGHQDADALAVTLEATRRIEDAIRACPAAWFWMHRRWRARPPEGVTEPTAVHHWRPHSPRVPAARQS